MQPTNDGTIWDQNTGTEVLADDLDTVSQYSTEQENHHYQTTLYSYCHKILNCFKMKSLKGQDIYLGWV